MTATSKGQGLRLPDAAARAKRLVRWLVPDWRLLVLAVVAVTAFRWTDGWVEWAIVGAALAEAHTLGERNHQREVSRRVDDILRGGPR